MTLPDRPVSEVVVPRSGRHAEAETRLRTLSAVPSVTDMAAAVLWPSSPQLVREMRASCQAADVIVLAHPYLIEAAKTLAPGVPLVYDAHNDEIALKHQLLPNGEAGDWWRAIVKRVETAAAGESVVVAAPTDGERESLAALVGTDDHILVVPNGTDAARVAFTAGDERARRTVDLLARRNLPATAAGVAVFVGSGHPPNLHGAERVVDLAPRMPTVQFLIVGRCGEVLDPARTPANVSITGRIADEAAGGDPGWSHRGAQSRDRGRRIQSQGDRGHGGGSARRDHLDRRTRRSARPRGRHQRPGTGTHAGPGPVQPGGHP